MVINIFYSLLFIILLTSLTLSIISLINSSPSGSSPPGSSPPGSSPPGSSPPGSSPPGSSPPGSSPPGSSPPSSSPPGSSPPGSSPPGSSPPGSSPPGSSPPGSSPPGSSPPGSSPPGSSPPGSSPPGSSPPGSSPPSSSPPSSSPPGSSPPGSSPPSSSPPSPSPSEWNTITGYYDCCRPACCFNTEKNSVDKDFKVCNITGDNPHNYCDGHGGICKDKKAISMCVKDNSSNKGTTAVQDYNKCKNQPCIIGECLTRSSPKVIKIDEKTSYIFAYGSFTVGDTRLGDSPCGKYYKVTLDCSNDKCNDNFPKQFIIKFINHKPGNSPGIKGPRILVAGGGDGYYPGGCLCTFPNYYTSNYCGGLNNDFTRFDGTIGNCCNTDDPEFKDHCGRKGDKAPKCNPKNCLRYGGLQNEDACKNALAPPKTVTDDKILKLYTEAQNACKDIHIGVLKNNGLITGPHNILPKIEQITDQDLINKFEEEMKI
jgi:hypothetical protein